MYNPKKIAEFLEYLLNEYNKSLLVEDIVRVRPVKETDKSFVQIGIRPLIDEDIFISPNVDPKLPSAGRVIAVGERDYFINQILNNNKIERINLDKSIKFVNYIISDKTIILASTKFYVEIFTQLMNRVRYGEKNPKLDGLNVIMTVPEKVLGNKIILIEKDSVLWEKLIFANKITGKKELLDIDITQKPGKADITIKSLNKIKYLDETAIKILEVKE